MPCFLSQRQRGHRAHRSAPLHDSVCQARTRAQHSDRLSAEQSYEHLGLCVLATRANRSAGIDPDCVGCAWQVAESVDVNDGAATSIATSCRSMGAILDDSSTNL